MNNSMKLCVSLDLPTAKENLELVHAIKDFDVWLKVGFRSYIRDGKEFLENFDEETHRGRLNEKDKKKDAEKVDKTLITNPSLDRYLWLLYRTIQKNNHFSISHNRANISIILFTCSTIICIIQYCKSLYESSNNGCNSTFIRGIVNVSDVYLHVS